jgi:hypothetical protein
MKLEVGMYVRTKYGYIAKITEANDRHIYCDNAITKNWGEEFNILFSDAFEEMVKASHNIIDLIEVGDYVNGVIVTTITPNKYIELDYGYNRKGCYEEDIKTIVTKERFEAMAYKVDE